MALNIKDRETDRLVRRLAGLTGENITQASRPPSGSGPSGRNARAARPPSMSSLAIARRIAEAPSLDDRTDDEILGYDERGVPN